MGQAPSQATAARRLAHSILLRVHGEGAFAERLLCAAQARHALQPADRALLTAFVYGTLRNRRRLDASLSSCLKKPLRQLPPPIYVALLLGAFQILCMRMAAHGAVHQTVELAQGFGRMRGLVNAVLRSLLRMPPPEIVAPTDAEQVAHDAALPPWIVAEVAASRGLDGAQAWAMATLAVPPTALRLTPHAPPPAAYAAQLQARGLHCQPSAVGDGSCLEITRAGAIAALPGYAEGHFCVQDAAAALCTTLLAPQPAPARILDLCAAPGGKTCHLAAHYPDARVLATDIHAHKMALIAENCARLRLTNVVWQQLDGRDAAALRTALHVHLGAPQADLVLLDAPCSGMGTLRRHAELRRRERTALDGLLQLQAELLAAAAQCVAPGGRLIYCVCSPVRSEGVAQVEALLARRPDFFAAAPASALGAEVDGPYCRTWTDRHGCDSFFWAQLCRRDADPA